MSPQNSTNFRRVNEHQFTDLRVVLTKYLFHWPLFLLGLLIAFGGAYLYLQLVNPVYEVSATILVKDEKKAPQEKSALQELDQSSSPKNAEAEIEILKSKNLVSKVVNDLQLWVTYTTDKTFKTKDIYETKPFKFYLIQQAGQLKSQKLDVHILDAKTFEVKGKDGEVRRGTFNTPLRHTVGKWVLKPTENLSDYIGSTISLTVNDPEKVSNGYVKSIDAHLLDKLAPTISLSLADEVPQRGKDVLNNLMKAYNEASSAEEKRTTKSTIDFIETRLATLTGELNSAEREVEGFRSSQGLTDITSQSEVYLENVQTNDIKLNDVNVQLNVINGIERYVDSPNSTNAPATIGINDPALNSQIETLSELQLKRAALLATTPEGNPVFEPLDRQIRMTKSGIRQTIGGIKSSLSRTRNELQSFNNRFESSIKDIPGQERQFVGMKRQQSIKENLYIYLLQKREELSLRYASTLVDARIVDKANVGDMVWPRMSLIAAIALLFGLGLPFLIIYLRESFNNKVTERKDIESALDVKVLGELSYEEFDKSIVVLENTNHVVGEQFRALRTNLHYLHDNRKGRGRVTLFTSSVSKEGKSFVSSNLAASLAASGRKTAILEMDLRKPKISSIFDLKLEHPGISDFLASDIPVGDIIQPSKLVPNLHILGAGQIPPNPSELLEKDRLGELISALREQYDDVIIDTPPVHLVTDAMIIARHVDVSLYIIKQGYTGKSELPFIKEVYEDERLPKMNIVFNGIKTGKYGYGYSYDNSYYTAQPRRANLKLFLSRF